MYHRTAIIEEITRHILDVADRMYSVGKIDNLVVMIIYLPSFLVFWNEL